MEKRDHPYTEALPRLPTHPSPKSWTPHLPLHCVGTASTLNSSGGSLLPGHTRGLQRGGRWPLKLSLVDFLRITAGRGAVPGLHALVRTHTCLSPVFGVQKWLLSGKTLTHVGKQTCRQRFTGFLDMAS
jgi:hypothetical protein